MRNLGRAWWAWLVSAPCHLQPQWEELKVEWLYTLWLESSESIFIYSCFMVHSGWILSWAIGWNSYTVVSLHGPVWAFSQHGSWIPSEQDWSAWHFYDWISEVTYLISAVFYWSSQSQRLSRFKGRGQRPCHSIKGLSKSHCHCRIQRIVCRAYRIGHIVEASLESTICYLWFTV